MRQTTSHTAVRVKAAFCCLPALTTAACQNVGADAVQVAATPHSRPAAVITPYTDALACLDNLLSARRLGNPGAPVIPIAVPVVPDSTGKILPGLRDMIANTIVRASQSSHGYVLVDQLSIDTIKGPSGISPQLGGMLISPSPSQTVTNVEFQVIGSLTQADSKVESLQSSIGAGVNSSAAGASSNNDVSSFAIDLRMDQGNHALFAVSNSMAVENTSDGINADFKIGSFGLNFDRTLDRREGAHQAARTLVELSMVELLGRLVNVPYWECLSINRNDPRLREAIARWYRDASPAERDAYVRQRLKAVAYPSMPDSPAPFRQYLTEYQQVNGLIPSGEIDFETYSSLMTGQYAAPGGPKPPPTGVVAAAFARSPAAKASALPGMRLDVVQVDRQQPLLQLAVALDSAAYLACYYRDENGVIASIYPNANHPNGFAPADAAVKIPDAIVAFPVIQPVRMTANVGFLCCPPGSSAISCCAPARKPAAKSPAPATAADRCSCTPMAATSSRLVS